MNTKFGIYTNVNGFYLLQNIPFGVYDIAISAVGYRIKTRKITIRKEEPTLVNVDLAPTPIELQAVTKTADRIKEIYETNISVQSLTQEEINLLPVAIEKDLFRAIKVIPGVSSTGDVTSQFYVRGGGGDQNLILFDNMMIYNPFHALGLFSIFNSDAIKVSEVLTGGYGPEFGGRLSSVVNIITREGNRKNYSGKLNFGLISGQGFIEGPIYNSSFMLSFRKSYFDQVLNKFIGKDLPLSFYDLNGKVTYDLSDDGRLAISGLLSHDKVNNSLISEPDYKWNNSAFGFSYQQTFGDRFIINVSFSRSFFDADVDYKKYNGKENSKSEIEDVFFNSKVDAYLENNDLISVGFVYNIPDISSAMTNSAGYYISNYGYVSEANLWVNYKLLQLGFLIGEFGFRENLAYLLEHPGYSFEPRMSLKYKLNESLSIKGAFGRYHQNLITTSNEDEVLPLFETWMPIEGGYLPERCDHYIFGIDGDLSRSVNLSLQGYYKKYTNLLGYNLNKIDRSDPDFSVGSGESYGFETFLKLQNDYFYSWVTYTLSWAFKTIDNITYPPKYDRRHSLNLIVGTKLPFDIGLNIHYEINSGLPFSQIVAYCDRLEYPNLINGNYIGDSGVPYAILGEKNGGRLPLYQRLDVSFSKTFPLYNKTAMKINLDIINLLDSKNIFYFNRNTGARVNMLPFLPSLSAGVEF
jgi:hypothetical protein